MIFTYVEPQTLCQWRKRFPIDRSPKMHAMACPHCEETDDRPSR
jgi:hypothetical protein